MSRGTTVLSVAWNDENIYIMAGLEVMMPTVSVVLPTYNRGSLLVRALDSVLNQTFTDFECLVVSDASTDDTAAIVKAYDDDRIRFFEHDENRGASAARNTAIKAATGEYIAFLDDDDEWLPTKLEKQVPVLDGSPSPVGLVYCWMDYFRDGELINEHHPTLEGYVFPKVLDEQRIGGCPTLLVRKSVVDDAGGFDESLPRGNDGDFIRRVCRDYEVTCVPETLVHVHVEHGFEQITRYDETGIRNAIRGHQAKISKFQDLLDQYPHSTANVYANLGYLYGLLGEWRQSSRCYGRALWTEPHSRPVYAYLARSIKTALTDAIDHD